jgi:hypothetical protein
VNEIHAARIADRAALSNSTFGLGALVARADNPKARQAIARRGIYVCIRPYFSPGTKVPHRHLSPGAQQANIFMWLRHRVATKRMAQTLLQADSPDL